MALDAAKKLQDVIGNENDDHVSHLPMIVRVFGDGASTDVPVTPETTCSDLIECCRDPGEESCNLVAVCPQRGECPLRETDHPLEILQRWGSGRLVLRYTVLSANGDSGYPLQPFLLTPVHHPPENSPQERYNRAHIQARNCVERCIGVLKTRFRCLLSDRVLKYDPQKAGSIITACVVLHNIMIQQRVPLEDIDLDINNDDDNVVNPPLEDIVLINEARRIQNNLFLTVFN